MIESQTKEYWLKKLAGEPNKSTFLRDCKKTGCNSRHMEKLTLELPFLNDSPEKFKDDISLFCFTTAGLLVLLHIYSRYFRFRFCYMQNVLRVLALGVRCQI